MSATEASPRKLPAASRRGSLIAAACAVVVIAAIGLSTKVVRIGADPNARQAFSADGFGQEQFPKIQEQVVKRAVDALTLGPAVLADKAAAATQYGEQSSTGAILPVRVTGAMGESRSGVYDMKVDGLPEDIHVRVQMGPAINGTDLRDFNPDIKFGEFKNQIEFQDAGSGINRAMKKAVLDSIDAQTLSGKTAEVVGVFRLVNPKNWLITPVKAAVK